jgi:glycosyltransferase involved in cell wall biosynthesis
MATKIRAKVDEFRPDVVHVHNTFPLLSPAIFHAIGQRAARVLTLHNYRLFCPAAIPMRRDGTICTKCIDRHSVVPSIQHGCYRWSRVATVPLAVNVALHRFLGTWTQQVDAFIALTEFQRDLMVHAGLPPDRVHVKPNFFPGNPAPLGWSEREDVVVFAGRLKHEKGVETLVRAWLLWGAGAPELRILGDGPLRERLEHLAIGARINFMGQTPSNQAQAQISRAKLVILPSEWFECFPMVIREAFAFGTPAAVTDVGPLPGIVRHGKNGVIFDPHNPESLVREVREVWRAPGVLETLGAEARRTFELLYTEEQNYRSLKEIYEHAMSRSRVLQEM